MKHRRQLRVSKDQNIQRLEHAEVFDDNLLPEASEIEQLHKIDPTILEWLKSRAAKEQDFRQEAYLERVKLINGHNQREHNTSRIALFIYFLLVAGCVLASYCLIEHDHTLQGSIFGSTAAILALAVLVTRRQPKGLVENEEKTK